MNTKSFLLALVAVLAMLVVNTNAFTVNGPHQSSVRQATSLDMTVLSHKGKKKDFRAGSPLKNACSALGVRPKYSCKK